jgi:hypothetical protein
MADQSDVEAALAAIVGGALYPNGIGAACAVAGAICRIYRGWPTPAALDADLAAGRVNVSVAAVAGSARVTTRYPDRWQVLRTITPSLVATVAGGVATFSGSAAPGQLAALLVDGRAAIHRTESGDTPASVAAALAAELQQFGAAPWSTAVANGASVSLSGARSVLARVTADQPSLRETRRQRQNFTVTCWCADPAMRDAIGGALDAALSGIDFIGLADGSSGRLLFVASVTTDRWEDAVLYRRELTYSVDYATTIAAMLPCLIVSGTQISPDGQGPIATLLG